MRTLVVVIQISLDLKTVLRLEKLVVGTTLTVKRLPILKVVKYLQVLAQILAAAALPVSLAMSSAEAVSTPAATLVPLAVLIRSQLSVVMVMMGMEIPMLVMTTIPKTRDVVPEVVQLVTWKR